MVGLETESRPVGRTSDSGHDAGPWKIVVSAALVAVLLGLLLDYSLRTGIHLTKAHTPMVESIERLHNRLRDVDALMRMERAGGKAVHPEAILRYLDQSSEIARTLFEDELNVKHTVFPFLGRSFAPVMDTVQAEVRALEGLVRQRLEADPEQVDLSYLDSQFNSGLDILERRVADLGIEVGLMIVEDLVYLKTAQRFLAGLLLILIALVGRLLYLSERKRRQRAEMLVESEQLFEKVCSSASDAIILMDEKGSISFWNQAAETIFGWTAKEALGMDLHELIVPERYRTDYLPALYSFMQSGEGPAIGDTLKLYGVRKNGGEIPVELSLAALPLKDELGAVGIVRDLSETVLLEDQLRQAQKMEVIGQLAGGVAHDFNNLLQIMQMNTEMALDKSAARDDIGPELGRIQGAVNTASDLTRKLLAFGRRQVLNYTDLDMNALIRSFIKISRRMLEEHIEITFNPGQGLGVVRADAGQIEQVLLNLCINARDAMPEGGILTIETKQVVVDPLSNNHPKGLRGGFYNVISVSDTGSGMSEEISDQIFEPFFTTKEFGKGTGLGLASVFGTLTQHGGGVTFETEPGKGSTFLVYLPVVDGETDENTVTTSVEAKSSTGTETILIAEDNNDVREIAVTILERAGYMVIVAKDGQEAVERFKEQPDDIDLVVLDMVMPRMNGKIAADQVRAIRPGIRILFSTGYGGGTVGSDLIKGDLTRLIQKPYQSQTLLHEIRSILDTEA